MSLVHLQYISVAIRPLIKIRAEQYWVVWERGAHHSPRPDSTILAAVLHRMGHQAMCFILSSRYHDI
jgi:hypothetical protein